MVNRIKIWEVCSTDVSKMHNNRTKQFFIETGK